VLYDLESVVAARTLMRRWDRPGVQVFPCLASNEEYSLHAEVFDPDGEAVRETFELLLKFLADTGQGAEEIWPLLTPFDKRNLVLLPRALQPHGESFDERFTFVGHGVEAVEEAAALWSPPPDAESVVLISLGTETDNADFFRSCRTAFGGGRRHVVMTLGRGQTGLDSAETAPANVQAHAWLPHPAVLPHAEVFVTHGGMGSIVEALYFGVPMVIVPHHPENAINGRRLAELGLGRVLPEADLTADALKALVEEVAGDPQMRANAARMRQDVLGGGGAARAVAVLEAYLSQDAAA
jgi:MGT family glycosyltransferase